MWAARILESDRARFAADVERLKSELEASNRRLQAEFDKRVFIGRTQFETEFLALADIWKKVAKVRATMSIPLRAPNKSDKDHQAFEAASKAVDELVVAIDTQSPFYPKEIYAVVAASTPVSCASKASAAAGLSWA